MLAFTFTNHFMCIFLVLAHHDVLKTLFRFRTISSHPQYVE